MKAFLTWHYGRMTTTNNRKDVRLIGKMAGLKYLHPHSLRHFCVAILLKARINISKIQVHLGHESIKSTRECEHLLTRNVQVEIYNLYTQERETDYFWVEEVVAL